jgi:hypothetical protein
VRELARFPHLANAVVLKMPAELSLILVVNWIGLARRRELLLLQRLRLNTWLLVRRLHTLT